LVERLYLRDLVTFKEAELEFKQGLVVFTGPSGAGKSVLISAILSTFGYPTKGAAKLCEVTLKRPRSLKDDAYLLGDEICIKSIKNEKLRYFIDKQQISKKALHTLFSPYVNYLSVRDPKGLESSTLLEMLDRSLMASQKSFKRQYKEFKKRYARYKEKLEMLQKIQVEEATRKEKMEFLRYEIEKIDAIDPTVDEENGLLEIKQQLSRIDKIKEALEHAQEIFQFESSVEEVYRLLDKESTLFSDAMNQLRADFEESHQLAQTLEETDVESVLDRLGELNSLKNRYGSIEAALAYREEKLRELEGYTHMERDKGMLMQFLEVEYGELYTIASHLSAMRRKEALRLERVLETLLASLKLPPLRFTFSPVTLHERGIDKLDIALNGASVSTLSGGEFNRIRLALMAATMPQEQEGQGVLILDEIDANVSGEESIAIAELITRLSKGYQIFAISHQPHLAAKASQHIVVEKSQGQSMVKVLDEKGRVLEIARIIGGEKPTEQAVAFARKLRLD